MKSQRRAACLLLALVSILVLGAIWDLPDGWTAEVRELPEDDAKVKTRA
jgi:hypothetical protein